MPYTKNSTNNETKFQSQPEEAPSILKAVLIPMSIPYLIMWFIDFRLGLVTTAILAAWIYFSQRSKNVIKYRTPSNFSVISTGINFNGAFYKKEDIHRLIIRNHMNEQYVFVSNYQSYHNPVSVDRALKLRQKLTNVSYRVDMESNGNSVALAGGLNEPTAYAILSDVCKVMDFKIS